MQSRFKLCRFHTEQGSAYQVRIAPPFKGIQGVGREKAGEFFPGLFSYVQPPDDPSQKVEPSGARRFSNEHGPRNWAAGC
jgi:hypothetical protein